MKKFLKLTAVIYFISQMPAFAYLDPGTGSMVIQTLIAGLVVCGVFFKQIFNSIKYFITGKKPVEIEDDE